MVQLSHPYMPTRKTIVLTRRTFFSKVRFLFFKTGIAPQIWYFYKFLKIIFDLPFSECIMNDFIGVQK